MHDTTVSAPQTRQEGAERGRRDFIVLTASAAAAVGAGAFAFALGSSLNPSADVLANAAAEIDVSSVEAGQSIRILWRGKPVFIRRRTPEEIKQAQDVDVASLRDPQKDSDRVLPGKAEWLIVVGICTHLGCVPLVNKGEFGGWFCPCHGSDYDTSGRIRKGPAPKNLAVPPYVFISDAVVKIG
ncbi:MAG: ubiquinol-cytochrome c reductase iron-sulfur subunit [Rickettsiales bacterium]